LSPHGVFHASQNAACAEVHGKCAYFLFAISQALQLDIPCCIRFDSEFFERVGDIKEQRFTERLRVALIAFVAEKSNELIDGSLIHQAPLVFRKQVNRGHAGALRRSPGMVPRHIVRSARCNMTRKRRIDADK